MNLYRRISIILFSLLGAIEVFDLIDKIAVLLDKQAVLEWAARLHITEAMEVTRLYILAFYTFVLAVLGVLIARALAKKWPVTFPLAAFGTFLYLNYAVFVFLQARMFKPLAGQLDMLATVIALLALGGFGAYHLARVEARKALDSDSEEKK